MADDPCEAACGSADPTGPRKYYRARYYDPKLGRFISEDPIGFEGGLNYYAYVGNAPPNHTDPNGLAFGVGYGALPTPFLPRASPASHACFYSCLNGW